MLERGGWLASKNQNENKDYRLFSRARQGPDP